MIFTGPLPHDVVITTWASAFKSESGITRKLAWPVLADRYRKLGEQVKAKLQLAAPSFCSIRAECVRGECDKATEENRAFSRHRCKLAVTSVSAFVLDYDDKRVDWPALVGKLDTLGLAYLVYDSPSHHLANPDVEGDADAPKWRLVLPLAEPWTDVAHWTETYRAAKAEFEKLLGVEFDDKTVDPSRIFYPPTRPTSADPARRVEWHNGAALDLRRTVSAIPKPLTPSPERLPARRTPIAERASLYLSRCDPSIQGQDGSGAAFHAASVLVLGFSLPHDVALSMLENEFNPRCTPPWSRKELVHKIKDVAKKGKMAPGCLIGDIRDRTPTYPEPEPEPDPMPPQPEPETEGPPALNLILVKDKPRCGFANLLEVLSHAPEFWKKIRLNDFAHVIEIHGQLPWKRNEAVRNWRDSDDVEASAYIEKIFQFGPSPANVFQAVGAVGEANKYHPVLDYLNACRDKWDGTKRIDTWLLDAGGCRVFAEPGNSLETLQDIARKNEYVRIVGRRFLIAAVARIRRPGCKMDTILILEGLQGKKKSTLGEVLFSKPWFTDQLADIGSKAADEQLAGKWGIEIPELDATKGASATKEKAFFSRSVDRFRPAYGRTVIEYPRTCVFVGTTNKGQYLKDETGARRFHPVEVLRGIDLDAIRQMRDQLWAEAVLCYESDDQWWLTDDESRLAQSEQDERYQVDALEEAIVEYLETRPEVTVDDILEHLFAPYQGRPAPERYSNLTASRVGKVLKHLGWEVVRKRDGQGGRARFYREAVQQSAQHSAHTRPGFAPGNTQGGPVGQVGQVLSINYASINPPSIQPTDSPEVFENGPGPRPIGPPVEIIEGNDTSVGQATRGTVTFLYPDAGSEGAE